MSASTGTALITGAGRGIGREVARTLASEGWRVLSGVRDPKSPPPATQAEVVDVADPESIEALAERLRARNQRLDALVNNAGVYRGPARRIWDVNVLGPLRLTRALKALLARNARVVMVTSVACGVIGLDRAGGDDRGDSQSCRCLRRERTHAGGDQAASGACASSNGPGSRRRACPSGARHVGSPGAGGRPKLCQDKLLEQQQRPDRHDCRQPLQFARGETTARAMKNARGHA